MLYNDVTYTIIFHNKCTYQVFTFVFADNPIPVSRSISPSSINFLGEAFVTKLILK